jgi:DnaJ-class molecular chaperone
MTITQKLQAAEQAVMVCPQCEGEGGYPDGIDEAACHTACTRCGGNGWIVNLALCIAALERN